MRLPPVVVLVLLLLAAACGNDKGAPQSGSEQTSPGAAASSPGPAHDAALAAGQSFQEGMRALCGSIDAVPAGDDPAQQQVQVARWLEANVTNPQVRELFALIGEMAPSQRPGMLSAAAAKAGLQTCALAER